MPIVFEEVAAEITPGATAAVEPDDDRVDEPEQPQRDRHELAQDLAALGRRAARLAAD